MIEDLDLLGVIMPRESDGLLEFVDFSRLRKLIMKYSDVAWQPSLRYCIHQRRETINDTANYKSLASYCAEKSEEI